MINCPFCNFEIKDKNIQSYFSEIDNKEYFLYECKNCLLKFFYPLELNPSFYENETFVPYAIWHFGLRTKLPAHNRMFFKYPPSIIFDNRKIKLLDVGCGEGVFLKKAEEFGFEVWGVDFDKKSIKVAKEKFKLKNVFAMSLEEFYKYAIKKTKFDIITFFEVLEHQVEPRKFLEIIYNLCENDGYIAGSVPNSDTFFKGGGYPPHHFLWFNKDNLKNILEKSGFVDINIKFTEEKLMELSAYAQAILTGKIGLKIKNFIIKKTLINKTNQENASQENIAISKYKKLIFYVFKIIRDYSFLPFVILLNRLITNRDIYFYAKKS